MFARGALGFFIVCLIITVVVAARGGDDAKGSKAFRWLALGSLVLIAAIAIAVISHVRRTGH